MRPGFLLFEVGEAAQSCDRDAESLADADRWDLSGADGVVCGFSADAEESSGFDDVDEWRLLRVWERVARHGLLLFGWFVAVTVGLVC